MFKKQMTVLDLSLFDADGEKLLDTVNATYNIGINFIDESIPTDKRELYLCCLNGLVGSLHPDYHVLGAVNLDGKNIYEHGARPIHTLVRCPILLQQPFIIRGSVYDNLVLGIKARGLVFSDLELFRTLQNFLTQHGLWLKYYNKLQQDITHLDPDTQECICLIRAILTEPYVILAEKNLCDSPNPDMQLLLDSLAKDNIIILNQA